MPCRNDFVVVANTLPLGHAFKCVMKRANLGLFEVDCLIGRHCDGVCLQDALETLNGYPSIGDRGKKPWGSERKSVYMEA